jgi:Zn-finger nucleic acid-binding protein
MNCPVCVVELKISDRQGVGIDYCPKCRGVWLERGELDKILDRANSMETNRRRDNDDDDDFDDDDDDRGPFSGGGGERRGRGFPQGGRPQGGQGERRESFWSNLFDFG